MRAGEVHALLGENGAGKSTLMNLLSGLLRPTAGEVRMGGQPVRFASPADAAARGIGMVHQHFLLVPPLSVAENLMLGASPDKGGPLSYPLPAVLAEAKAVADRLGWRVPWDAPAGNLPVGTQQRIEILKALRGQTRVLIFDEPTAVLTPTETPELFATIRTLAAEGRGIVFISHKLDEVLSLSDRVTVLRRGRVVLETPTAAATARSLAEAMVGTDSEAAEKIRTLARQEDSLADVTTGEEPHVPAGQDAASTPRLAVTNLTVAGPRGTPKPLLDDLSFDVAPGEIFGIAGVDGNGQEELAECLAGLLRAASGTIAVDGQPLSPGSAAARFRHAGIAVIPADRQTRGLALPLSVTENLALGVYDAPGFRRGPLLRWPALRERAKDLVRRFDIRTSGPDEPVSALSGGNQQKVVVARALADTPRVVVAVNPTRGLDVGAIAYVHDSLRRAQTAGAAIVLISTELSEVLSLADRVAVLFDGAFTGVVPPTTPREQIGLLMGGSTGGKERG